MTCRSAPKDTSACREVERDTYSEPYARLLNSGYDRLDEQTKPIGYYLLPKRRSYFKFEMYPLHTAARVVLLLQSLSRDSSVSVDCRLEADRVETSPRSPMTRTTKESKDVEVPPSHFMNKRRVGCWSRPTSLLLLRSERRRPTRNQSGYDVLRNDTSDFDESRRTCDGWADDRREGECDVMVTDCLM